MEPNQSTIAEFEQILKENGGEKLMQHYSKTFSLSIKKDDFVCIHFKNEE
jgi:hypothetical protein